MPHSAPFFYGLVFMHQPKTPPPLPPWSSSHILASLGAFGLLLPSPASLLALTNAPLATIAPSGSLPVCGHGYWGVRVLPTWVRNAEQLSRQQNKEQLIGWLVLRAGCANCWPHCCKLSDYILQFWKPLQIKESVVRVIWNCLFFRGKNKLQK